MEARKRTPVPEGKGQLIRLSLQTAYGAFMDPSGNIGKTWFLKKLEAHGMGCMVHWADESRIEEATVRAIKDLHNYNKKGFTIGFNLARSDENTSLEKLYVIAEQLKDGKISDDRYHGITLNLDRPAVVIMTNKSLPSKVKGLSADRIVQFRLKDGELYEYNYKAEQDSRTDPLTLEPCGKKEEGI